MNDAKTVLGDVVHVALVAALVGAAVLLALQPSGVVAFNSVEFGTLGGAGSFID